MPIYVLDTDSVTFHQAGRENFMRRIRSVPSESVFATVISVYEQLRGRLAVIHRSQEDFELIQAYKQLQTTLRYFSLINVLPFTSGSADMMKNFRSEKLKIGTQDLRIAAIVSAAGGILITSNRRDFDKVPGLIIEDWNT
ncbi:MAG: hypothetical protein BWK80_19705 [Desulfobacteraceae bacterium IS3]|nr:MAG: hypothetical protein BWK80_19705 [Desulfobacteraceae bacterium IS3]HAO23248.1 nucleic acid-binding protein [Desulfobacteraceae bacterium]